MGELRLALLGTPEVHHAGQRVMLPTRKALALLIYLAVEGGQHTRERLAALFWPDSDAERSRMALRRALSFVREALGDAAAGDDTPAAGSSAARPHLVVTRDLLGLDRTSDVALDVQDLYVAWNLAHTIARLPSAEQATQLQAAANLYRGDFGVGFSLDDAPEFDDWVGAQREAWHRRVSVVFDRLARWQSEGGDLDAAIDTATRWTVHDRLNEAAYRFLMRLHHAAGDRAAALHAFETCRAVLVRELHAEPAAETVALAERCRTAVPRRSQTRPGEAAIPLVTVDAPLVGRTAEHAQVVAAYSSARRGRAQGMVIEGEPGIGKTRLATEFLAWAKAQGADVLQGRALETGGRLPYQPLVDALRARLGGDADPRALLTDVWVAELSRLLPELRDRYADLPLPPPMAAAEARMRLSEAVTRLGQALAAEAPVVLFVDDVQWADAASLDLLQYAGGRWAATHTPLLVLLSARSDDLATTPALSDWLASLERGLPLTRTSLGPLTEEDTHRLVLAIEAESTGADLMARAVSALPTRGGAVAAFGAWLFAETGGHPFFITETVKALFERAMGAQNTTGEAMHSVVAPDTLPSSVRAVIRRRLARLGAPARAAVAAAAVLGQGFSMAQLGCVAGLDEDAVLAALDDLLARRLLREAEGACLFAHDRIREVAYADVAEARRGVLHRRALEALESAGASAAELARHALAAGLRERALPLSIAAGDDAMRLFAARDAIRHFEQARALARTPTATALPSRPTHAREGGAVGPGDDGERLDLPAGDAHHLYAQLGRAYELTAEYAQARAIYEDMLSFGRAAREPATECLALNRLATLAATDLMDFEAQTLLLEQALAVAEAGGDRVGVVETAWNLARLTFFRADFAASRAHAARALALAREAELTEQLARTLNWLALGETWWACWVDAQAHALEARSIYAALGDKVMEADSLVQLASALIRSGQTQEGLTAACAAHTISVALDNKAGVADAAKEMAQGLLDRGDYGAALEIAEAGVAAARVAGYAPLLILNLTLFGRICRQLGKLHDARVAHEEAWQIAEQLHYFMFTEAVADELCADHALVGEWVEAAGYARQASTARQRSIVYVGLIRWYETEALVRAGEAERAAADVRHFGEDIKENRRYRIPYLRALAVLAHAQGDTAGAITHLEEARAVAEELDLDGELWPIEAALTDLYWAHGDEDTGRWACAAASTRVQRLADKLADDGLRARFLATEPIRRITAGSAGRRRG